MRMLGVRVMLLILLRVLRASSSSVPPVKRPVVNRTGLNESLSSFWQGTDGTKAC
jgi:hypothetical protein